MSATILGLGHYSRTGKDSFANEVVAELQRLNIPAIKRPFAWKLKQVAHDLYGWTGLREPEFYDTPEGEPLRDVMLPVVHKTPVQLWVALGNAARDNVYIGTWIQYVLNEATEGVVVIPDVRYMNEVEAIRELNGTLIRVVRPGVEPRSTVADRALIDFQGWDFTLGKDGLLKNLLVNAKRWAEYFATYGHFPKSLSRHYV